MESQSKDAVYRINLELRVIATLVFLGYFIGVTAAYYLMARPDQFAWGLAIFGGVVVTLAYNVLSRWRLIITEQGITRRRYLLGADHWTWEDFASGKIQKRIPMKLVDRQRPLWRRTINLEWLSDNDAATVMQALNWHYKPEEVDLPDEVKFKYGIGWVVTFTKQGIRLRVRTKLREYSWSDVERIRVLRMDAVRQDFVELQIFLPEERIKLSVMLVDDSPQPSWRGAKAEEINEYLRQHVPPDRWREQAVGDEITEVEDLEAELENRREHIRATWIIFGFSVVGTAVLLAWVAQDGPVFMNQWVLMGLLAIPVSVGFLIAEKFKYNKVLRCLEEARQEAQQQTQESLPV